MNESRAWRRWLVQLLAGTVAALSLVLLAPVASATTPDPGLLNPCRYRSGFGGSYYCLVTIEDVAATRFGTGKRVYLDGAFVTDVAPTTITVAQTRYTNDCIPTPEHPYCGAGIQITFVYLKVAWSGTHRPAYGTQLRLYGPSIRGSLTPRGYVSTGYCTVELAEMELC